MAQIEPSALKTVHVIGDSHALGFKGKCVSMPDYGIVVNASVEYIVGLTTDKLVENRQLRPEIVHYFLRNGIITKEGVKAAATADQMVIGAQYATGTGFHKPLVIFTAGEIFIRHYLGSLVAKGPVRLSEIHEMFSVVTQHYARDVAAIRAKFGVYAVIHEICPPTADDAKFEEINKYRCPADLRAAAYSIFNTQLMEAARNVHVPVCRSSDYLAENGFLKEEYEFDGVHADPKYAFTSLERAVSFWLHNRVSEATDRYFPWCSLLDPNGYKPEISRIGLSEVFTPFRPDQLDDFRRAIAHFEPLACLHPTLDWAHQPPTAGYGKGNDTITYGDITTAGMEVLRDVMIKGPFGDTVRKLFGGARFSIINVRPVHSLPHAGNGVGQQSMHLDGCPPGVFRAIVYLNDVSEENGPFEYIPVGKSEPVRVTGKAGSTIVFDANAVLHRATPPRVGERWALDLILLVHPEACTEIVDCRPGFTWPIDPYMFGVSANCLPRLKADRWFNPALVAPKKPAKATPAAA